MIRPELHSRRKRLEYAIKRTQGLIGYYLFNEVEGTTVRNYAPGNRGSFNGTSSGGPTQAQPGKVGRCYSFDASNDTVGIPSFPANSHNIKSFFALANWVASGNNCTGFGVSGSARCTFGYQATNLLRLDLDSNVANSSIRISSPSGSLSLNNWFMIGYSMAECDPTVARVVGDGDLYINGTKQTKSSAAPAAASGAQTQMNLGSAANNNGFMNGKLQHAAYFNRILTDNEFRNLAHKAGFI